MPRYELALRTSLSFRRFRSGEPFGPAETVPIRFEGRDFVWHAIPDDEYGENYAPGLTVVADDEHDYAEVVPEIAERFLSAMAFEYDRPIDVALYGGTGRSDPFAPPAPRERATFGGTMHEPPAGISVADDSRLRLALALYREGLNAGSSFYGFLAYWNTLDAVFEGDSARRDECINTTLGERPHLWPDDLPRPDDAARELRQSSRHAIAHVVREPGRAVIDPDLPDDRKRLAIEERLLHELARVAIEAEWPDGVRRERYV